MFVRERESELVQIRNKPLVFLNARLYSLTHQLIKKAKLSNKQLAEILGGRAPRSVGPSKKKHSTPAFQSRHCGEGLLTEIGGQLRERERGVVQETSNSRRHCHPCPGLRRLEAEPSAAVRRGAPERGGRWRWGSTPSTQVRTAAQSRRQWQECLASLSSETLYLLLTPPPSELKVRGPGHPG